MSVISLYPSRLSIIPTTANNAVNSLIDKYKCKSVFKYATESYINNFKVKANPFIMSKASKKKLYDSINYLYTLSSKRNIKMKNGKTLYNFKCAFITLTLPSKQVHSDIDIKKECLNHLFTILRRKYSVKNYVWKAELQKNNNIHFHIVTDSYIDYNAIKRHWNNVLKKLGYIDAYSNKFDKMSLSEYHKYSANYGSKDFNVNSLRYAKGKKNRWLEPNTVDVKSIIGKNNLASYLAKYISKNVNQNEISEEEEIRQFAFGRCWFRSRSLSNIKNSLRYNVESFKELIEYFNNNPKKVKKIVSRFFTVYYYSLDVLDKIYKDWIYHAVKNNAEVYNYSSA